ncbi:MAG: hypothetical protein NC252_08070 [Roseburia sp.]|nr:hypothetical protein [Roseburia sp.]MCM1421122.1 hypothetical protein [Bacteroides sp.]MCM1511107.1 hypothetical protein [Clostridium sp.]
MDNTRPYHITLSRSLLIFLQEDSCTDDSRFSRYDAFLYLLDSAAENPRQTEPDRDTVPTVKGEFVTSYSELSEIWNWHRSHVREFIQALAGLDVLTTGRVRKKLLLTLPLHFDGDRVPVRLLDEEQRGWLRFIIGMTSLDEFLSLFDSAMTEAETGLSVTEVQGAAADNIGRRIRHLLDHLMLHAANIHPCGQELDSALRHLFVDECGSDLMSLLSLLSFGGLDILRTSVDEVSPFHLSEAADEHLRTVLKHYSVWPGKEDVPPDTNPHTASG